MSNEEIITEVEKGLKTLNKGLSKMKQALSSANIAVGQAEAYNKGLEDAWELARKICGATNGQFDNYDTKELGAIFGKCGGSYIINENTYQEALAKIEAYEKEQAKIKVGDVVKDGKKYYLVTKKYNNTFEGMSSEGYLFCGLSVHCCEKTDRHIDLTDIFKQIGGADE